MKFSTQKPRKEIQTHVAIAPFAFLVLIVAIGGLSGCVGYTGAKKSTGQTGVLSGSVATLTFGNVGVSKTATQSVTVTNTGTANVSLGQSSITGSGFTVTSSVLSGPIAVGQSVTVQIQFAPQTAGAATGSFTMASDASNSPLSIALTGTGTQPGLASSPAAVSFGNVGVGSNGSASVTLSNTGSAVVTISQASVTGTGFSVNGLSAGLTIQPGQSTNFTTQFSPTSTGNAGGSISVSSSAPNSPMTIALSGTGTQPGLAASPSSVSFGNVVVGKNGSASVNLSNTGSATVTISQASATGNGFSITGLPVGQTIQPGQSISFTAQFSPTSAGNTSGSISVSSNAPNSPMTVALTGKGTQAQIGAVPSSAAFGNVTVGNSNSQTITVTNSGTSALVISQGSASGSGFSVSGLSTPLSIPPGASSTFNAVFTPSTAGNATGAVSLVGNAPDSPFLIPLSGSGVAASLLLTFNVPSLSFGSVNVGSTSDLAANLMNTGNSNVMISAANMSGAAFTVSGVSSGETLTPNQSIPVTVQFAPTTAGSVSGKLNVVSNATDSPTQLSFSGTGTQQTAASVGLNWTASTSTVIGYNVYRGTTNGGPYTSKLTSSPVASTQYTDTGVQSGLTYYYVLTSVDSSNVESVYSGQASAMIP